MTAASRRSIGLVIILALATPSAFAQEVQPKGKPQSPKLKPSVRKPKPKAVLEAKPDPTLRDIPPKFVLAGHKDWAYDLAFSPDGKTLASVGTEDETLRIWDVSTGRQLSVFTKKSGLYGGIVECHDGRTKGNIFDS